MKTTKKIAAAIIAMALILVMTVPASASEVKANFTAATSGTEKKIKVKTVKYDLDLNEDMDNDDDDDDDYDEEDGNVELKFSTKLKWSRKASVKVTDEKAAVLVSEIADRDSDDCELYIEDMKEGHTYTVVITGVKAKKAKTYGTLTITFQIPAPNTANNTGKVSNIKVKEAEYDEEDGELELKFSKKVQFSDNAEITITDEQGKKIEAEIVDTDSDECTIEAELEADGTYYFVINGIKEKKASSFGQLSGSFVVEDD